MPGRKNTVRCVSEEVQGDDSFVIVRRVTVKEMQEVNTRRREAEGDDPDVATSFYSWYANFVCQHVASWNWVDDEEAPLPQPKDAPEIYDSLTTAEISFLDHAIFGNQTPDEAKN